MAKKPKKKPGSRKRVEKAGIPEAEARTAVASTVTVAAAPPARKTQTSPRQAAKPPPAERGKVNWLALLLPALVIIAAGLWTYWPALHGTWLWDDDYLIENNDLIHDPEGFWNIWFDPTQLIDFFPLTVSVEWLEWQIWPDNPFAYHLTSVLFHLMSALLVWHLLSKLGLRRGWVGGLLFAIHPVQVESVAWMAELKNTLSLPPFLLAMCAWIDFEKTRRTEHYLLALVLFLIAMLCKTTMVMFPVMILLYAWWLRRRVAWKDILHTAPFFAISFVIGLTMVLLLKHGVGEETIPLGGILSRLACAGLSIAFYFSKAVLPVDILPIYPQWNINPPTAAEFAPWVALAFALYWMWKKRQSWGRHALLGVGFFVLNLIPFVGLHTISFMRFTWVMDHFLYLPIIGLIALAVAALEDLDTKLPTATAPYRLGFVAILMMVLAWGSHAYAGIFVNSETQWTYAITNYPEAWPAYNDLGNALSDAGRLTEAKLRYEQALKLNPGYPEAHNNLGIILFQLGETPAAIAEFKEAIRLCPALESAQQNLTKLQDPVFLKNVHGKR